MNKNLNKMKKIITFTLSLLVLFIGGIQQRAFCQFNPIRNCYCIDSGTPENIPQTNNNAKMTSGITCIQNGFWTISSTGSIDAYTLSGNTVTFSSNVLTGNVNGV